MSQKLKLQSGTRTVTLNVSKRATAFLLIGLGLGAVIAGIDMLSKQDKE
jgi:hypothetical protein